MSDCLGIVLAGGLSSRMGEDKAHLQRGEQTMLDYTTGLLKQLGLDTVISGQEASGGLVDQVAQAGPVGGIYSVLKQCEISRLLPSALLIVPIDMPLLTEGVLNKLLLTGQKRQVAAYYERCYLPLYLPVNETLLAHLKGLFENEQAIEDKKALSVRNLLATQKSYELPLPSAAPLLNTNTPEEWRNVQAQLKGDARN